MKTRIGKSQTELRDSLLWRECRRLVVALGEAREKNGTLSAMISRAAQITLLVASASDSTEEGQRLAALNQAQSAAVKLKNEMIREERQYPSREILACLTGIIRLLGKKNRNYEISGLLYRFSRPRLMDHILEIS